MPKKNTNELQSEKKTESDKTVDNVDNTNKVVTEKKVSKNNKNNKNDVKEETAQHSDKKATTKKETTKKATGKKATSKKVKKVVADKKEVANDTEKKGKQPSDATPAKNDEKVQEHSIVEGVDLKFTSQLPMCREIINDLSEKVKDFKQYMKKLESAYKQDVKKVSKTKRKRKGNNDPTGFIKTHPVPDKLAKYIGVDSGTELSGPDVTKKVWAAIKNKGLQYEKDGRVLRTNKETNDVFGLNNTVNKSTDHNDKDGFNFRNIQKYISYALHNK